MLFENKTTEFKREYIDDVKKTVIAFANTDGGKIYIGLEDDGTIVGISKPDDILLQITNSIRDTIRPDVTLFTECAVERMHEKVVIVITVQQGTARPYYLAGKGIRPEGIFVRHEASTVPATESAILNMIKETSGDRYEDARALNQQLTFEKTTAFFKRKDIHFSDTQMRSLGLISEDGTYTNLALLLSDQCGHTIKLAVFGGTIKTVFKDRREFSGSLLDQLDETFAFIDRYNSTRAEFSGLDRIDIRDYPPEAIREALLNAIVHRDYSFSGSSLISIFDDRIEFVTIGGLVKGISYDDIMLGISITRNQRLANIFYRLRLIEAYGTGIKKIQNCYSDFSVKPLFEVSNNAFKITLPNMNYQGASQIASQPQSNVVNSREDAVLRLLKEKYSANRMDVQESLGVSQATAILLLREMTDKRLITKEGSGKLTRYCLH